MRELHDHYFRLAKSEGYRSRAAYKLKEIDDRRHVLKRGDRVLDCGAAPGSWMQVAAERVGERGRVVGVDLLAVEPVHDKSNVAFVHGDLANIDDAMLLAAAGLEISDRRARFDVIISDMAPNTSGDRTSDHHRSIRLCELVLDRAVMLLKPGGNLVMKFFEGELSAELLSRTKKLFEHAKAFKPKASRSESFEMYVIALGYRGTAAAQGEVSTQPESAQRPLPPNVKRGWGKA
jgi:23S rRNA (uridine2552-2'-O)-methyltransferase